MIEARAGGAGFFVDANRFVGNIRRPSERGLRKIADFAEQSVSGRLTETALLRRAASAA